LEDRAAFLTAVTDVLGHILRTSHGLDVWLKDIDKELRGIHNPILARLVMHVSFQYTAEYVAFDRVNDMTGADIPILTQGGGRHQQRAEPREVSCERQGPAGVCVPHPEDGQEGHLQGGVYSPDHRSGKSFVDSTTMAISN
jgi:hypothetical protein